MLLALVVLASVGCTTTGAGASAAGASPSAALQTPPAPVPTEPAKVPATFQATAAPVINAAACRPGDVTARLVGFGPAMGTMYVLVGITPTNGPCSLPTSPNATAVDAAGARVSVGRAPDIAAGSRVAVTTQGIGFRIAVHSWCEQAKLATLDLVLDPAIGLEASVALPADFAVACTGSATSLSMGAPVEP